VGVHVIDYHIHTNHSPDAEGSLRDYCEKAAARGLNEICFTNHAEMDPERNDNIIRFEGREEPLTNEALKRLHHEVMAQRDAFGTSGLKVRSGIEIGFFSGMEKRLVEMTSGIEYDFLMGSIHCLDHACIDSSREYRGYFSKHGARELLDVYYEEILKLAESRLFDAMGHIDVYKKYGINFYGPEIDYLPRNLLAAVFDALRRNGLALEINAAGLRRIDQFYPSPEIMKLARDLKVERLTVGSDCHKVDDLGKGIKEACEYAKSFGFSRVFTFEKRKPIAVKI
jgi:histidinol-phosphatase (PHP family)